jgi:membrane-bound ClpP family serine protease
MSPLVWITGLLLVGLVVMVLEVFIPSGGLLGFISIAAIVAAVATAFAEIGVLAGFLMLAITAVAVPATLALAFHLFPSTPLGRRIMPAPPDPQDLVPTADAYRHASQLLGQRGRVLSDLLPWGQVQINGERIEAMSQSGPITAGEQIEVVAAEGRAVIVRPAAAEPTLRAFPEPSADATAEAETPLSAAKKAELRSQTLEEFEFDDFERPSGA